jgi:hypothetical protein
MRGELEKIDKYEGNEENTNEVMKEVTGEGGRERGMDNYSIEGKRGLVYIGEGGGKDYDVESEIFDGGDGLENR